jgi:hypothetical protein
VGHANDISRSLCIESKFIIPLDTKTSDPLCQRLGILHSKNCNNQVSEVKEDEKGRACSTHGVTKNVCKIFVRNPERKRQLDKPRHGWEDNIQMDLRETGWAVWIGFIWIRIGTGGGI